MKDPADPARSDAGAVVGFPLSAAPRGDSRVVEIARQLLTQLLSGQMEPGTRLPSERQLAEALQVGRSTVREALKALDVLGIIDVRLGDGTYLKQSSSDLLPKAIEWGLMLGQPHAHDLVEARRHIEIVIAGLAAERATDADVEKLEAHLETMKTAPDDGEFIEGDVAFHLQLAEIADNAVLQNILVSIRSLLRVWIRRAISHEGSVARTIDEHSALLEAVRQRSPELAHAAMHDHMEHASQRLHESLSDAPDEVGGDGSA